MPEEKEKIIPVDVKDEMKEAYLSYAMSVIVGRALPDARDGLKPVQRRILYAMNELGLHYNQPYKKSARVVGDVLGKYHPHGDMAVYDALVRMAQGFTYRYPMVDGHGNFGSIDGDPPAAMRYTEVRLSQIAEEMLLDIEKNTVEFIPNFDESMQEPIVLPALFPQLLANGATGIAVGMATNIPPHNLSELVDATVYLIDQPQSTWKEILEFIPGPDFPTHGIVMGTSGIHDYFRDGRGKLILRGEARIEDIDRHHRAIIIRELPYQVNKASLVEDIARLILDKKINDVSEVRDESDRDGIRIVLELKKNAVNPNFVLNYLYRHTALQTTFGVNLLALVNGRPEVMGVPEVLRHFIEYRKEVVTRRSQYELKDAEEKTHILEGFLKALDLIDEVIQTIRSSQSVPEAKSRLIQQFQFTDPQTQAILEMRLQRLVALEREKIVEEYRELQKKIDELKDILTYEKSLMKVIKKELLEIKRKYGDARRTRIVDEEALLEVTDLIPEEDIVITLTQDGYVKRVLLSAYRRQARGGRGVTGITTKEEDLVSQIAVATTLHKVLFFTSQGRVFQLPAYQLTEMQRQSKGIHLVNLLQLEDKERVITFIPLRDFGEGKHLFFVTARGIVKKSDLLEFVSITRRGIRAINLDEGDELSAVFATSGEDNVLIATAKGYGISFMESEVRPMGRSSRGVKGISLRKQDRVVGASTLDHSRDLLIVSARGMGKRVKTQNFPVHHRGGKGIILMKFSERTSEVIGVQLVTGQEEILISSQSGTLIRINCSEVSVQGRSTRGVTLVRLHDGDLISSFALVE